jgi:hypothetical protein
VGSLGPPVTHTPAGHGGVLAGGELPGDGGHHHSIPYDKAKPRVPSMRPDELGIELAGVHGGTVARLANTDRDGMRGVVCELHRANVVLVPVRSGREGGWRGEVHGVAHSGELGQNSGEPLPWLGAVSLRAVASMG